MAGCVRNNGGDLHSMIAQSQVLEESQVLSAQRGVVSMNLPDDTLGQSALGQRLHRVITAGF